ncbi:MAG: pyrroloquinoline quinone biosynthesis protein PqqB, partial [Flavobacteriaceae bacterium]|nr:pyrroloquinoline quinone biosynthesis protein PqqB [Flavobacteriaceae bacterium]
MKLIQIAYYVCLLLVFLSCKEKDFVLDNKQILPKQYITVLGIAQDAGYPHIGCEKKCCQAFYSGKESKKHVTSLGLVDQLENEKYLFEATPDISQQLQILETEHLAKENLIDGVFLT